jgi:hypothetical protein
MMWQVSDEGKVEIRLKARGEQAIRVVRVKADRYVASIVGDLSATLGTDVVTDELRYSFNKTRPEVTVTWRARIPVEKVPDVREYMVRLAQSEESVEKEIADESPDQ